MTETVVSDDPDPASAAIRSIQASDGGPILSFQLDRVPEISVLALDGRGQVVAHEVAEPDPGPISTTSSS